MKLAKAALLIFTILLPNLAWARPACTRCEESRKLESEFLALNYKKAADRAKGRALVVRALDQLERFHTTKRSATRPEEFRALVKLVAAALPYDLGTETAESIASLIADSKDLKTIYNDTLAAVTDSCRQQFLRTIVDERLCYADLEKRGAAEKRGDSCIRSPVFRYDKCVGLKSDD